MKFNGEPPQKWLVEINPHLNDAHQSILLKLMVISRCLVVWRPTRTEVVPFHSFWGKLRPSVSGQRGLCHRAESPSLNKMFATSGVAKPSLGDVCYFRFADREVSPNLIFIVLGKLIVLALNFFLSFFRWAAARSRVGAWVRHGSVGGVRKIWRRPKFIKWPQWEKDGVVKLLVFFCL